MGSALTRPACGHAGPAHEAGHADAALVGGALAGAERRAVELALARREGRAAVRGLTARLGRRPGGVHAAVVGEENHNRVGAAAEGVEAREQPAHRVVEVLEGGEVGGVAEAGLRRAASKMFRDERGRRGDLAVDRVVREVGEPRSVALPAHERERLVREMIDPLVAGR